MNREEYIMEKINTDKLEGVTGGAEYYTNEYGYTVKAVTSLSECQEKAPAKLNKGAYTKATNSGKKK